MNSVFLVEINLFDPNAQAEAPIYLTNAQRSITNDGKTYSSGYCDITNKVVEKVDLDIENFKLKLSAIDDVMTAAFTQNEYLNRQCLIYKADLDANYNVSSKEIYFDGDMADYEFVATDKTKSLIVPMVSGVGALGSINSIDLGVVFGEYINDDQTTYWGKERANYAVSYKTRLMNDGVIPDPNAP